MLAALLGAIAHGPALGANTPGETSSYYEDALRRFEDGDVRGALVQLKNALQENPDHLPSRVLIGRVYVIVGNGAAAEKELRLARQSGADERLILAPLARSYLMQTKYKELLEDIRPGGRSNDLEAQLLDFRGTAYLNLHELLKADREFARALRLNPRTAEPRVGRARVALKRGRFDEALDLLDEALVIDPDARDARYFKGLVQQMRYQHVDAVETYSEAIRRQPGHLPARAGRVDSLISLGLAEQAQPDVDFMLRLDRFDIYGLFLSHRLLLKAGDASESAAALRQAENVIRAYPPGEIDDHLPTSLVAARVYLAANKLVDARSYAEIYVQRDPYNPIARKVLGEILLRQGEARLAAQALYPAVRIAPDDPELLTLLGSALLEEKSYAQATEFLERALELAPNSPGLRAQVGFGRFAIGRRDEAIGDLSMALEQDPEAERAGALLAMFYLREREYESALAVAQQLVSHKPDDASGHAFQAAALYGLGDVDGARASFEKALEVEPHYRSANINLARMDEKQGRIKEAEGRYLAILEGSATDTEAMRALAELHAGTRNFAEAARWLEKIVNVDKTDVDAHLRLIEYYLRTGEAQTALLIGREVRENNGETVPILEAAGRAELAAGEREAAVATLYQMAEKSQDSPRNLLSAARLLMSAGENEGAHRILVRAVVGHPDYRPAQAEMIRLEGRSGRTDDALQRIEDLRRVNPDWEFLVALEGEVLFRAERYAEAADKFNAALQIAETSELLSQYARARIAANASPPIDRLEAWLEQNPADVRIRHALAASYMASERPDDAVAMYESVLDVLPNDAVALNNLAILYMEAGDPRATGLAERSYTLLPENPAVIDTYGWVLVRQGDPQRGLAMLRDAFARDADNARIRYHIAFALNELGRTQEARQELEAVLRMTADPEIVGNARALRSRLADG